MLTATKRRLTKCRLQQNVDCYKILTVTTCRIPKNIDHFKILDYYELGLVKTISGPNPAAMMGLGVELFGL